MTVDRAWIHGGSPTTGFLSFGVKGPFAEIFHSLAGVVVAGIMLLMWLALLFPENNPIIDEYIVYALVLALLARKSKTYQFAFR